MIDEAVALRTATLVAPVPRSDRDAARALRGAIAADTAAADLAARTWTGLGVDLPPTRIRVVSRRGWVRANLIGLRGAFDPLAERFEGRPLASKTVGLQLGVLFGLLSSKVLGQYVLPLGGAGQAQLVLIGPNVLELADRHGRLADGVRRTILLHEIAHRLQFDAVPWLGDHLRTLLTRYLEAARLDPDQLLRTLARLPEAVRAIRDERSATPLIHAVLSDEQRGIVDEAQALMSLLEGHGNATMYQAAHGLVDDPAAVRAAFEQRRTDLGTKLLSAVAGLEMKRRQYDRGEAFVRHVVDRAGTEGLNRAFDGPATLPDLDEIDEPDRWMRRVGVGGD